MAKFRKKPVVIEAWQFNGEDRMDWPEPFQSAVGLLPILHSSKDCVSGIRVQTLEGRMYADIGDWIIKGVAGEFYPCKPEIFEATYEAVAE